MVDRGADSGELAAWREMFENFGDTTDRRAPLYAALSRGIAADDGLVGLLGHAPPTQRMPVLLFAAVHDLVLDETDAELARWYPNLTDPPRKPHDPALMPTFRAFVDQHHREIVATVAQRSTQTNEVGRCALFVPVLASLADEHGAIGHLDVGTSAGLTLLSDRYSYRYRSSDPPSTHEVGPASPVVLDADVSGSFPWPARLPVIRHRLGIDRSPIDVTDPAATRWLEACVWPDQADRFHRLVAALAIARSEPPAIVAADAVAGLADGVTRVGDDAHPVVTNSWVLNYLTPTARLGYVAELDRIGEIRDLSWLSAEAPAQTPELPWSPDLADSHLTILTLATWRHGQRTVAHLATCHPHGYWLRWR